jgi:integrase/recombinase XerC
MTEHEWMAVMARFEVHLQAEKSLSALTVRNYKTDIDPLFQFMQANGVESLTDLNTGVLRRYLAWLIELGYVRRSVARKLSTLRTFLKWLVRTGVVTEDPLPRRGVMKLEKRLPTFLSGEEAERLVTAPDTSTLQGQRDRALLELIYGAGLRVSEATGLDITDVDLKTRTVRVTGKGSKQRMVTFGGPARDALSLYMRDCRPKLAGKKSGYALFLNRFGGRLSQRSIQEKVRLYATKTALRDGVHTHTLRHSFATHMLEGGADLRVVQELMGHSSAATTQIYTHVTNTQARKVYLASHPRAAVDAPDGEG